MVVAALRLMVLVVSPMRVLRLFAETVVSVTVMAMLFRPVMPPDW